MSTAMDRLNEFLVKEDLKISPVVIGASASIEVRRDYYRIGVFPDLPIKEAIDPSPQPTRQADGDGS